MSEDKFKILEERLTRLEATLAQRAPGTGGFMPPGGVVVDPAPWQGGGWSHQRAIPSPVVDPAPWQWGGGWGGWGRPRWPTPVVDPAPWPPFVSDPAPWPPTTVSDPAPWPGNVFMDPSTVAARNLGRFGPIGDPPPPDFSRLSLQQLESTLHSINAERARLDSMESMVKKQIETAKKQPG